MTPTPEQIEAEAKRLGNKYATKVGGWTRTLNWLEAVEIHLHETALLREQLATVTSQRDRAMNLAGHSRTCVTQFKLVSEELCNCDLAKLRAEIEKGTK